MLLFFLFLILLLSLSHITWVCSADALNDVENCIRLASHEAMNDKEVIDYVNATNLAYLHGGFPYLIFNPKNKAIGFICLLPKSGSTLWKYFFLKSLLNVTSIDFFKTNPHSFTASNVEMASQVNNLYQGYFQSFASKIPLPRFMLVRDPYTRLLSGYLDKVASGKGIRFQRYAPEAFKKSSDRSFQSFVKAVTETKPSELNSHFRPQHLQCGLKDGVRYNMFLKLEEMPVWYEEFILQFDLVEVAQHGWNSTKFLQQNKDCFYTLASKSCAEMFSINGEKYDNELSVASDEGSKLSTGHATTRHSTHSEDLLLQYYKNRETVNLVTKYFKSDFEIFDYPLWNFSTNPLMR